LAWLIAYVNGFPREGTEQPLTVRISPRGTGERWVRTCNGRSFSSTQQPGHGRSDGLVAERFGPVAVHMALLLEGSDLRYVMHRWTLFGVSLPLCCGPRCKALESTLEGSFKFDVEIAHPLTGLIIHYVGTLTPA
jgi:hypothetical protein